MAFSSLIGLALALPVALARTGRTGISPLNRVVEKISEMMNIPSLNNPTVQVFFIKFLLFVLFLAVAHFAFKKVFDNKTAGVVATVFALIAAFLMPASLVTVNGGVIAGVLAAAIPLGIVGGVLYLCVTKLNENFITRLLAIVILFALLSILDIYYDAIGLAALLILPTGLLRRGLRRKGDR